jgi:XTP/dITP diphosphohydrolase
LALVNPRNNRIDQVDGTVEGVILDSPRGDHGFGYDPVFFIPELGKTMAELTEEEKNSFSHRGRAARKMVSIIKKAMQE